MRDLIETALKGHDGDYCEIRIEESASTSIMYRGKELEDIGATTGIGGNVRAAVKGGWGFVSFNDLDDLDEKVSLAVRQARLAAQTETRLAEVEPVVGVAGAEVESDAADIPLADKKAIMDEYVDAAWSVSDKIQTSQIYYSDGQGHALWRRRLDSAILERRPVHHTPQAHCQKVYPRSSWTGRLILQPPTAPLYELPRRYRLAKPKITVDSVRCRRCLSGVRFREIGTNPL